MIKQTMFKVFFYKFLFLSLACISLNSVATEFLKPEEAFLISGKLSHQALSIQFTAKPGYYMYQESFQVQAQINNEPVILKVDQYPPAHEKFDPNFQKVVRTYKDSVVLNYSIQELPLSIPIQLEVQVQGCAEKGICYPPMTRYLTLTQYDQVEKSEESLTQDASSKDKLGQWWQSREDLNSLNRILATTSLPILLAIFFLLGVGLAFTPCMLPMLPILSSVVFGTTQHHQLSRKKTTILAGAYILGMACAFSLAGMATAWFGSGISAYLQSPIVTIGFGALMVALAGSLLGWYELQLPTTWHNKVHHWMGKHQGGNTFGVFMLGALSSLIASPCVTAPLAGVLTFIAQTGKVSLGGLILFVMAMGMGLPLLLFAVGARSLVPKAGSWMIRVQKVLAILLIAYAGWMIYPAVERISGSKVVSTSKEIAGLDYQVITRLDQLHEAIIEGQSKKEPIFITYYADWCVSCKEIDQTVLSSDLVKEQLSHYKRLEVDITEFGQDQKALLKEYQLFGPPAFIFIDINGQEKTQLRSVGLISVEQLQEKLR
jgi:thiol:disulfide interchange protein DsbD